jgi:hypothetical protein
VFSTQEAYVTPEAAQWLVQIRDDFVTDLSKDFDVRKAVRPLLDTIRNAASGYK